MTKIVILEGNATCGKSVLQKSLADYFRGLGKKVMVVDEKEVTKSFVKSSSRNVAGSLALLRGLIEIYFTQDYDYIIFDRFHFTHAVVLDTELDVFGKIEILMNDYDVKIVYLYYSDSAIIERIRYSIGHRTLLDPGYIAHLHRIFGDAKTTKEEDEKMLEYYALRNARYAQMTKNTIFPVLKIDVTKIKTKNDYASLLPRTIKFIEKK
jgi:deoxyadenosine/deoxycytidine kinase